MNVWKWMCASKSVKVKELSVKVKIWKCEHETVKVWKLKSESVKGKLWKCERESIKVNVWKWKCESECVKV